MKGFSISHFEEAARRAGVRPNALRMQIRKGKLKATKRGRDWTVTLADLLTWEINKDPRGRKPGALDANPRRPGPTAHHRKKTGPAGRP